MGSTQTSVSATPRRRWYRRWWFLLLFVLLCMIVGFAILPYLLSSPPGEAALESLANRYLRGSVRIGDLSIGWGGPTVIEDLRILDPQGRDVLVIPHLTYPGGVWRALTDWANFGTITARGVRITLYVTPEGVSLAQVLPETAPRPPTQEPSPPTAPPPLRGQFVMEDGTLTVVRQDGASYRLSNLTADVTLDTLDDVEAAMGFTTPEGARVRFASDLRDLLQDGALQPAGARGTATLNSDRPVELGPFTTFLLPASPAVQGALAMDVRADIANGTVRTTYDLTAAGVHSVAMERREVRPLSARLAGSTTVQLPPQSGGPTALGGEGRVWLAGAEQAAGAGEADVTMQYRYTHRPDVATPSFDEIVAAVLASEGVTLPDFEFSVTGSLEVEQIASAVPGLLAIDPNTRVTGGTLRMGRVHVAGGASPSAVVDAGLTDVVLVRDGNTMAWDPITLALDATLAEGLRVRQGALDAGFASARVQGTLTDLQAQFRADLTAMMTRVRQWTDVGEFDLRGLVQGELAASPPPAGPPAPDTQRRIPMQWNVLARNLYLATGEGEARSVYDYTDREITFAGRGMAILQDGRVQRYTTDNARLDIPRQLTLAADAGYAPRNGAMEAELRIERAQLGELLDTLSPQAPPPPLPGGGGQERPPSGPRLTGMAAGTIQLARADANAPLLSSGALEVRNLQARGERVGDGTGRVEWREAAYTPDPAALALASLTAQGAGVNLRVRDAQASFGDAPRASGTANLEAQLAPVVQLARALNPDANLPDVQGQLAWAGKIAGAENRTRIEGQGNLANLRIARGDVVYSEPQITFAQDVGLHWEQHAILVQAFQLDSAPLDLQMRGDIQQYDANWHLNLRGEYAGDLDKLTALLHAFAPSLKGHVALRGLSEGDIIVRGPARQPEVNPVFRGLTGATQFGWKEAELEGVTLEAARFSPRLEGGVLHLAETLIAAQGGQVRLLGDVDFRRDPPVYALRGRHVILDRLRVDRDMSNELLSRFNPIFAEVTDIEGEVSLTVEDLLLPVNEAIKTAGAGRGHLDLREMKVRPAGVLATLLQFANLTSEDGTLLRMTGIDFVIRDGRVLYNNFRVAVSDDFDMLFRGAVGFDNSVDMVVSLPLTLPLLERLGVKGPVADYARILGATRVEIPLTGDRRSPSLDLSKVDIRPLIEDATKRLLERRLEDLIRPRDNGREGSPPEEGQDARPGPRQSDPVRDILDLIRQRRSEDSGGGRRPSQTPSRE